MIKPRPMTVIALMITASVIAGWFGSAAVRWCATLPTIPGTPAGFLDVFDWSLAQYNRVGFKNFQDGFNRCSPPDPALHEVVKIENLIIHVVGSRQAFKWDQAAAHGSPVLGYATRKNEIYIFGAYAGGKIIINQAIIGHELNHILNFKNPAFADPDHLEKLQTEQ